MRETIAQMRTRRRPAVSVVRPHESLRAHAVARAHDVLDEVPGILRGVRTFLLMASIAMVAFSAGVVFLIWHVLSSTS
jgi:hypothetical protein